MNHYVLLPIHHSGIKFYMPSIYFSVSTVKHGFHRVENFIIRFICFHMNGRRHIANSITPLAGKPIQRLRFRMKLKNVQGMGVHNRFQIYR